MADDDDLKLQGNGLEESLLGDEPPEPVAPPTSVPARPPPVAAALSGLTTSASRAHDAYVQLGSTEEAHAPEAVGEFDREDRERSASEVAMARQMANARSFQTHIAGEEEALKKIVRQEEKDMEMAMRLQMEAESDVRSHSQSQEESDAALAAKLQARFGNTATASSPAPSTAASTPPPVTKKVTVRVTVPPNVGPGQQLVVNVPNHAKYSVTVPAGAVPGSQFLVHITSVTNVTITVALDKPAPAVARPAASAVPAAPAAPAAPVAGTQSEPPQPQKPPQPQRQ